MFATYDLKNALTRAVEISLFTWRRAADDDALDDDQRYGWSVSYTHLRAHET